MISKNFYYRVYYQFNNGASRKVFYKYLIDRFFHPFNSHKKKQAANRHKRYLKTKKTSTDYFSINAFYWNSILNKKFKDFSYLEIGSWEGNSALYVLKNFKTKSVICVDVWDKYLRNQKDVKRNFKNFLFNLKEFKNKFKYHKLSSDEFFKKNKKFFDVIYIDGDHKKSQVYKDISSAWRILNNKGLIICDDFFDGNIYKKNNKNVAAVAINRFIKKYTNEINIISVNNNQIFFEKNKIT